MRATIDSFSGVYRPLSNFWYTDVTYHGEVYATNEHAFQAAKAIHEEHRRAIQVADSPGEAKRMGGSVPLRKDWEEIKITVMRALIWDKFSDKHPKLKALLTSTGDAILVEGNTWGDVFWGVCNGNGRNHLGKLLMERREELLAEEAKAVQSYTISDEAAMNIAKALPVQQAMTAFVSELNTTTMRKFVQEVVKAYEAQKCA